MQQPPSKIFGHASIEVWIFSYVMIFIGLGVYLAIFNTSYFDQIYTLEDSFLEWLTVIALTATAALSTIRVYRLANQRSSAFLFITGFTALLFWFGAGEEISWGQRLFNWQSHSFFQTYNAQAETNLHNLMLGNTKINQLVFGKLLALCFAIYFFVLTPLYHRKMAVTRWMDAVGIPIPKALHLWGYFFILLATEGVIQSFSDTLKRGELTEMGVAFMVLLNVAFPYNGRIYKAR